MTTDIANPAPTVPAPVQPTVGDITVQPPQSSASAEAEAPTTAPETMNGNDNDTVMDTASAPAEATTTTTITTNTTRDPSASPPLPTRHTAATPGPRASRLTELYASSLSHTLGKISWENFASCYPTIASRAPGTLKRVQKQMVDRLAELCNKEFDRILESRGVVSKLNELESLYSDAARRRSASQEDTDTATAAAPPHPTPPHLLPPEDILAAHLRPHLASQTSQLNARLQTTQSLNSKLFEEIRAQRAEIDELLGRVEMALRDVDAANELLDGEVEGIGKETRAVEMEMAG